jgi:hypothetical protein
LTYLVYLDVWERHITHIEDNRIREVALGGPDTATRAKLVWQVKTSNKTWKGKNIPPTPPGTPPDWRKWVDDQWSNWPQHWQPPNRGMLKAQSKPQDVSQDPCITSRESGYLGAENHLYRVELHRKGPAWDGRVDSDGKPAGNAQQAATFKWSRENGSVTFPICKLAGKVATVECLGRTDRLSLKKDDWVEIIDDDLALRGETGPLRQVVVVKPDEMTITLNQAVSNQYDEKSTKHPLLRRWDYEVRDPTKDEHDKPHLADDGALRVRENSWLTLEDGVQVLFSTPAEGQPANQYRTGDYWLIPARTATGDVEWPKDDQDKAVALGPHGVEHHYAPLCIISVDANGAVTGATPANDCRRKIKQLWQTIRHNGRTNIARHSRNRVDSQ